MGFYYINNNIEYAKLDKKIVWWLVNGGRTQLECDKDLMEYMGEAIHGNDGNVHLYEHLTVEETLKAYL